MVYTVEVVYSVEELEMDVEVTVPDTTTPLEVDVAVPLVGETDPLLLVIVAFPLMTDELVGPTVEELLVYGGSVVIEDDVDELVLVTELEFADHVEVEELVTLTELELVYHVDVEVWLAVLEFV